MDLSWKQEFQTEINQAHLARAAGNEGKARVCARRAAGIVVREFLARQEIPSPSTSAYNRLRLLAALPDLPQAVRISIDHLIVRVTTEHDLPIEADLIQDAEALADHLLQE